MNTQIAGHEDIAGQLVTMNANLNAKFEELNGWKKKHDEQMERFGSASMESKNAIADITRQVKEINVQLNELYQHANRPSEPDRKPETIGRQITKSAIFQSYISGGAKGRTSAIPVILSEAITSGNIGTGVPEAARLPGIREPGRVPLNVRSLLSVGRTQSSAVEFVREKLFTNNAAPVAEGASKPESGLEFELDTANVRTIAHWIRASKQILDDTVQLESYIDSRLLYGLKYAEDNQLINGDGTGANVKGLKAYATDFNEESYAKNSTTVMDRIADAALQVAMTGFPANGMYMNPVDANDIRKQKDTIGRYMFADPSSSNILTPWGLPVIESLAVEQGSVLIGSFALAAQIFDRADAQVDLSESDGNNFTQNLVTIRVEERLALAVYYPQAIVNLPLVKASSSDSGQGGS